MMRTIILNRAKNNLKRGYFKHSANGLKARVGAERKTDNTPLTLATQENAIKKTFDNRFLISLDFNFFKHPVYAYGLKEVSSLGLN